jgi:trimethylamine--corrinoid protein Co-methyltransferase
LNAVAGEADHTIHRSPSFRVLAADQIGEIHRASLEVLERTGVEVLHEPARTMLEAAGCRVEGRRVRYPASLVERCISTAPSRVVIHDRTGRRVMFLEGRRSWFGMGSDTLYAYDPDSGQLGSAGAEAVARSARVADSLPHIDYVMSLGIARDAPQTVNDLVQFQQMVQNTTKPICFTAHHRRNLKAILDMAAEVAGGMRQLQEKPFVIHYSEPNSPLMLTAPAVDKLLLCAELRIPLLFTPGSMAGGTAPVTPAGAVVISNAESLSGLVLHQVAGPGAPIISGGNSMVMDLLTSICSYGAPEFQLAIAAYTELYHHYRIPVWGFAGCSDAHLLDEQAALEATFSIMTNALAGANLIHDVGYLSSGLTSSCELLVLSDEIIGMVKRLLRGVAVDAETLAVEAIDRVGPGGHFLTDEHTLAHFRSEFWRPGLLNRDPLEIWQKKGSLPLRERLGRRVREILQRHRAAPLPPDVEARLAQIIAAAEEQGRAAEREDG